MMGNDGGRFRTRKGKKKFGQKNTKKQKKSPLFSQCESGTRSMIGLDGPVIVIKRIFDL